MAVPAWLSWLPWLTDFWNKWAIRVAAGLSLVLHIALFFVADIRRYNNKELYPLVWMFLLWVVYQGLRIAGNYALSNLSLDSGDDAATESEQLLVAFWAPFLLLHLGGPDNIGAYSLDDDKLSWRKFFEAVTTVLEALYVVVTKLWFADGVGLLRPASIIMFVVGFLRLMENAVAILRALVRRKSEKTSSLSSSSSSSSSSSDEDSSNGDDDDDDRKAPPTSILFTSAIRKHSKKRAEFLTKEFKKFREDVQKDALKIYDVVYTKAGQVDTWAGYLLRLLAPVATATAFALFGLYPKDRVQLADVIITYVLLSAALVLDMVWLVAALASESARKFVEDRPGFWFRHQILCGGWWCRVNRISRFLHPWCLLRIDQSRYSSCTGSLGQHDLLEECTTPDPGCLARLRTSFFGEDALWTEYRIWSCLRPLEEEMESLFERMHQRLQDAASGGRGGYAMADIRERWGQRAVERKFDESTSTKLKRFFGREFQEDILLWHIGTTVYLYSNDHKQRILKGGDHQTVKAIETASEYLMFLTAARPDMLPGTPLRSLYDVTKKALRNVYKTTTNGDRCGASGKKKQLLAEAIHDIHKRHKLMSKSSSRLVGHAAELADQLHELEASSGLRDVLGLVFDVWVDKLLYAGIGCSRDAHARQLGRGGEFITIAWITAEYAGVFEIGETGKPIHNNDDPRPPDPDPVPDNLCKGFHNNDDPGPPDPDPVPDNLCKGKCPDGEDCCCCPKEKETCQCHCHQDPLETVCPHHTSCTQDYCWCRQEYYYC